MKRMTFVLLTLTVLLQPAAWAEMPRTIKIVTPEWEFITQQDGTGLFFEIVKAVYEPAGIKVAYSFAPWKRAMQMVNKKEADAWLCVWAGDVEKQKQLRPEWPIFVECIGVIFPRDRIPDFKGLESLAGKKGLWLRGYDFISQDQLSGLNLQWAEVDEAAQAWKMIRFGRADFFMDAITDIDIAVRNKIIGDDAHRVEVLWKEKAYVAFADTPASRELTKVYDEEIQELFQSGKLKAMYEKWKIRFSPEAWSPPRS